MRDAKEAGEASGLDYYVNQATNGKFFLSGEPKQPEKPPTAYPAPTVQTGPVNEQLYQDALTKWMQNPGGPAPNYLDFLEEQTGQRFPGSKPMVTESLNQTTNPDTGHILTWDVVRGGWTDTYRIDPNWKEKIPTPPTPTPGPAPEYTDWDTAQKALAQLLQFYGEGYYLDPVPGGWNISGSPKGKQPISPYEQEDLDLQRARDEWTRNYQQQQLDAQKKAQLASMAANPVSWLEYSIAAGKTPVVQPSMLPLYPQDYVGVGGTPITAGQNLPGWDINAPEMSQLPALTNPSIQYWARMGPTAQDYYRGYEKMRTGTLPEETSYRIKASAPPSGWNQPLQWQR